MKLDSERVRLAPPGEYTTQFVSEELPLGSTVRLIADTSWARAGSGGFRVVSLHLSGGNFMVDLRQGGTIATAPVESIEVIDS